MGPTNKNLAGQIDVSMSEPIVIYSNGLPFDDSGRLCVTSDTPAWFQNGIPLNASGRVCIGDGGPVPSFSQDFSSATALDPRVDFTRGSEAAGWVNGQLKTFGINEPRFVTDPATGYSGLLLEPFASTNLIQQSQDVSAAPWVVTNGLNVAPYHDPRGLLQNTCYTEIDGNGFPALQQLGVLPPNNQRFTLSFNARLGPDANLANLIHMGSATAGAIASRWYVVLSPSNGEIIDRTPNISDSGRHYLGDDVYRYWLTVETEDEISQNVSHRITSTTPDRADILYIGNHQLEFGTKATSYIPTGDSQVTRAGDYFTLPVGDWYRPDRGTLLVDAVLLGRTDGGFIATLYEASFIHISTPITGEAVRQSGRIRAGDTNVTAAVTSSDIPLGERSISAISWGQGGEFVVSSNGAVSPISTFPIDYPNPSELRLATRFDGSWHTDVLLPNAVIRRVAYYPDRLTDAQLAALTGVSE